MMHKPYTKENLVFIDRFINDTSKTVIVDGFSLSIPQIVSVARRNSVVKFTKNQSILRKIKTSYKKMMQDVENGVPVYGTNTGYGARASHVLANGSNKERVKLAKQISEGISHVDISVGPNFDQDIVRSAMIIRINMLFRGVSGVKIDDLEIYRKMLNRGITPVVNQYGGIGASGDLAHNGRILNAARQLKGVRVWDKNNNIYEASYLLKKEKIPSLKLDPKAGLGLVNGDNFSTALACLIAVDTLEALLISCVLGSMVVEVLKGTNRSFHPMLGKVRPHSGQVEAADLYRYLLDGSKLAYQEMDGHHLREDGIKVQDGYSLRGISQYYGVNFEKIKQIFEMITINANSVSDNPLWVSSEHVTKKEKPWHWVSGANFLATYMAESIDALRKIMTQIVKLNDRHLARMIDPNENNGLPPNLSDKKALTQCAFKGVQIQSGMFDVYSSLLSIPVTTFFGVHEEGNQDITSHALTSGILGLENLRVVRYSLAQNLLAVVQAVDLRGGSKNLSSRTRPVYDFVRKRTEYVEKEKSLNNEIESLYQAIKNGELMSVLRKKVFADF